MHRRSINCNTTSDMRKGKKHNRCLIRILATTLLVCCSTIYISIVNEYYKEVQIHSMIHYPKSQTQADKSTAIVLDALDCIHHECCFLNIKCLMKHDDSPQI